MLRIAISALISCLMAAPSFAATGPNLTPKQISKLKMLGAKIVAPTYLPEGCGAPSVTVESEDFGDKYTIEYDCWSGKTRRQLVVAAVTGGLGGPGGDDATIVYSPHLNKKLNLE